MMRSRGRPPAIRASTFQYHPRMLLYRTDSHWHDGDLDSVCTRMRRLMPSHLRSGFRRLCSNNTRMGEDEVIEVVHWMEREGRVLGFRIPHATERARATGRAPYLLGLGLNEHQLYDLVGNHFDPDALLLRMGPAVQGWLLQRSFAGPTPVPPHRIMQIYQEVRTHVMADGVPTEATPFPRDLQNAILANRVTELHSGTLPLAAEDGRGTE